MPGTQTQLWALFWIDENGQAVLPIDCNPGHEDQGMLVYRSEEAAKASAERQNNLCGVGEVVVVAIRIGSID